MPLFRLAGPALSILATLFAISPPARAQEYGTGDQVLHIGSASLASRDGSAQYFINNLDGYLYPVSGTTYFVAPLTLPEGAEIKQICLYARDTSPTQSVRVDLQAMRLVPGGVNPGIHFVRAISTSFDFGHGVVCTAPFSYLYQDTKDFDGDGAAEHLAHHLLFQVGANPEYPNLAVGGVRVVWRRQVTPAPGAATFGDVPTTHPFFRFVEALVAAGITAGCGENNFCPDQPLTRGQMAVFLSAALGLHWPN